MNRIDSDEAADEIAKWARQTPQRKRSTGASPSRLARIRVQVEEMLSVRDFTNATASHLVSLYAMLHERVYGVQPLELIGKVWQGAVSSADKLVRDEFGGDYSKAVAFMQWTWQRENEREAWRRRNGVEGSRIGWRLQFQQRHLLTDYRISNQRNTR